MSKRCGRYKNEMWESASFAFFGVLKSSKNRWERRKVADLAAKVISGWQAGTCSDVGFGACVQCSLGVEQLEKMKTHGSSRHLQCYFNFFDDVAHCHRKVMA